MLSTEEEARAKECWQWITEIDDGYYADGKDQHNTYKPDCSASECMAWRWEDEEGGGSKYGYCGRAGRPV